MEFSGSVQQNIKTFLITSCKGGVGKSTVAANIAMAVANHGKRVLLVDCDFSNRSLDLILGCEEEVVYDICDLVTGRATAARTVMQDSREARLNFIAAPHFKKDEFTPEQFAEAVMAAAKEFFCEYVFIDTPGAVDGTLQLVAKAADAALIVTSHQPTTVRGAEKTGYQLEDLGVQEQYLVINRYDKKGVLDGTSPGLNWLIDHTHVPLIGVIPDSKDLEKAQIAGKLACQLKRDRQKSRDAFDEVARRICGERIPIMSYLPEKKRRKLLYS
jgi:septum site-determining protein MinD